MGCMASEERRLDIELKKDEAEGVGRAEAKSWSERLTIIQEKPYLATLGLVGVFLVGVGILSAGMIANKVSDSGVEIMEMDEEKETGEVFVDVGGAVMRPGLYKLSGGSRVNDALVAAGGLSEEADRDWFSQKVNLAAKLTDGAKLYIPFQGIESAVSSVVGVTSEGEVAGTAVDSKINVNTASASELDGLWGVGPVTAEKIINGRPYASVEELKTRKILKSNVYERIKDEVSVY